MFWEPNTSNFTRHTFLDLFFYLFLMTTKLMSIFQTFVPQYNIPSLEQDMASLRTPLDQRPVTLYWMISNIYFVFKISVIMFDTVIRRCCVRFSKNWSRFDSFRLVWAMLTVGENRFDKDNICGQRFHFSDYKSVNKRLPVGISSASQRVDRARWSIYWNTRHT